MLSVLRLPGCGGGPVPQTLGNFDGFLMTNICIRLNRKNSPAKLISSLFHKGLKAVSRNKNMEREDLVESNAMHSVITYTNKSCTHHSRNKANHRH